MNRKQHTVISHVEDLIISQVIKRMNGRINIWLNNMHGECGKVKTMRGNVHDNLGMIFDFSDKYKAKIDTIDYMKAMVDSFTIKFILNDTS